jgi:hypothetical protein
MANFAQLDENSIVIQVIAVNNDALGNLPFPESEPIGEAFCKSLLGADTNWKQTSYHANFRNMYAGIETQYHADLDVFTLPKPFPSWILNQVTYVWEAPVAYPSDKRNYFWDEASLSWQTTEPEPNMDGLPPRVI